MLEQQADEFLQPTSGYFQNSLPRQDQIGAPMPDRTSLGLMRTDSLSTFKPVQASRLSFVGTPQFDPSPFLDPLNKKIFNDPLETRAPVADCHVRPS